MSSLCQLLRIQLSFLGLGACVFFTATAQSTPPRPLGDTSYLNLTTCVELALDNDLGIKKSLLSQQSSQLERTAAYMNLLPDLRLSSSGGNSWGRSIDPTTNSFVDRQIQSISLGGSSNWVLFQGLQNIRRVQRAQTELKASDEDLKVQRNLTILSVITLFLDVLINQELFNQAQLQLESNEIQLQRSESMWQAGALSQVERLDARAQRASSQVDLIRAENALNFSILRLKQLLLLPYEASIALKDEQLDALAERPAQALEVSVEEIYNRSLILRPEIKSAALRLKSTELSLKMNRGSLLPTLSLNANLRTNYSSAANRPRNILGELVTQEVEVGYLQSQPSEKVLRPLASREVLGIDPNFDIGEQLSDNLSRSVFLSLSIPLFERWRNYRNIQGAKIAYQRARIEAQEARNSLRATIEQTYNDAISALNIHQATVLKLKAAEEAFRVTESSYATGASSYLDYRIQSNRLYQARAEWIQAKYVLVFRRKIIDFYLGDLTY